MKCSRLLPILAVLTVPNAAIAQFSGAVTHGSELSQFFRAAQSTRVDIVAIGDSNQLYQGHGWDHGWILAVDQRLGTYASSLLSLGENSGNSAGVGVGTNIFGTLSQGTFEYEGAPAELNEFLTPGIGMRPLNYVYVPDGETRTLLNHGLIISTESVVNTEEEIRFHLTFGRFPGKQAVTFRPSIRLGESPYSVLAESEPLSNSNGPGLADFSIDFVGLPARPPIQFMLGRFNTPFPGPFIAYTVRAEHLARSHGASFSTLYGYGGQSARDMASALMTASDEYLKEYFERIRNLQGQDKFVLVRINSALNDRNESLPPVDGSGFPPASPEAYAANIRSMINRISTVWDSAGWPTSELYFLITPSHPVNNPDQPELLAYRDAARELADEYERCAVVDLAALTDATEMLSQGWYQSGGGDRNHLTQPAYETLALRELDALLTYTSCPDIDGDGIVGLTDLNAVLAAFGTESARSDVTGDGIVGLADLNNVLQAFGGSCQASSHD